MKAHLKRLAAPKTWPIARKGTRFLTRPAPAGSPMDMSMPLVALLKQLKLAVTTKEVKRILQSQEVLIDGRRMKSHDKSLGFWGNLAIPSIKAYYRLTINNKNTLTLIKTSSEEAANRPVKIKGKTVLPKGKTQLNCSSGINITVDKNAYARGDTILIDLKTNKVAKHLPFERGALVLLNRGTHVGHVATVKEFTSRTVALEDDEGNNFETSRKYCFVVGKKKPEFTIA